MSKKEGTQKNYEVDEKLFKFNKAAEASKKRNFDKRIYFSFHNFLTFRFFGVSMPLSFFLFCMYIFFLHHGLQWRSKDDEKIDCCVDVEIDETFSLNCLVLLRTIFSLSLTLSLLLVLVVKFR